MKALSTAQGSVSRSRFFPSTPDLIQDTDILERVGLPQLSEAPPVKARLTEYNNLDLLTYQVQELSTANLNEANELEQLLQERERLNHVVDLQQMSYKIYQALYQNDNEAPAVADLLGDSEATLNDMVEYDSQLQPMLDLVRDAQTAIMEVGRQINAYGESLEADPQRLAEVEARIRELKQICRKYRTCRL